LTDSAAARRTIGALGAALAIFTVAKPAQAQRLDDYLNASIPGFNVDPGVTVTSRLRPEYDYPGLRLGSFVFDPELTESAGYSTNVTGTATPQGSPTVETNLKLNAVSDWGPAESLGAGISVDNTLYSAQPRQNFTNWTATIGGSHDFGYDTLYVGYAHLNLYQTPSSLDAPQLDSPIAYRVDTVRLSYRTVLGQTTLTPGIEVTRYNYDNGTVQGVPYVQSYRDRAVYTPSLIAAYEFAPLRSLVMVVRYADAQYTEPSAGQATLNYTDATVLGGVNFDTAGPVRLRALVGYETRHYASSQYPTISAPILEAAAVWTPTGLTTVTGDIARYIQDSASENTVGYTETALKLSVDHEYLPNVLLNGSGALYSDNYAQNEGTLRLFQPAVAGVFDERRRRQRGHLRQFLHQQLLSAAAADRAVIRPSHSSNRRSYMASRFRDQGTWRAALCVLTLALLSACAPGRDAPPLPPYTDTGYRLGPGDQLRIITYGEDQLTGEFTVDDQGNIQLPLLATVQAAGQTPEQLAKNIANGLQKGGMMRDASVAVQVLAYRPIFVLGEVAKPGQYPYQPGMTLLTAVANAGGFTYRAVEDYAYDVRSKDGKVTQGLVYPDSFLAPGDVVKVYLRHF
jgi:polysaccharide export outer membrane protein